MSAKKNDNSGRLASLGIVKKKINHTSFPKKIERANKLLEKAVLLKTKEIQTN